MRSVKHSLAAGIAAGFVALAGTATTAEVTAVVAVAVSHRAVASRLAVVSQAAVMDMAANRRVVASQAAGAMAAVAEDVGVEVVVAKVATTKVLRRVRPTEIVTQATRKNQAAFPLL